MFHVEQRSSGGNQASGEELFHVEHCPAILTVRLQHYAIRLRRNMDCGLLNFAAWTPTPREIHGGARCSTWNRDSLRHLLTLKNRPRETFRRGAGHECSTWNIHLARAAQ